MQHISHQQYSTKIKSGAIQLLGKFVSPPQTFIDVVGLLWLAPLYQVEIPDENVRKIHEIACVKIP